MRAGPSAIEVNAMLPSGLPHTSYATVNVENPFSVDPVRDHAPDRSI